MNYMEHIFMIMYVNHILIIKKKVYWDIKKYCMEQLNYSKFIDRFNGSIDTLLIP